jgi:hypothetical protein
MELINRTIAEAVQSVIDGKVNPLEVWGLIKEVETMISKAKAEIEAEVIAEGKKYNGQTWNGWGIEVRPSAGRWDFSANTNWNRAKDAIKDIEDAAKSAYKEWEKGRRMVTDDGEIIAPAEYKAGKETIFFSRKGGAK